MFLVDVKGGMYDVVLIVMYDVGEIVVFVKGFFKF